jgi:DnaK suppressor protein
MLTIEKKDHYRKLLFQMLQDICIGIGQDAHAVTISLPDTTDRASAETELAFSLRMTERKSGLERKIEKALQRIDEGVYGVCEECGEEISEKRLRARPVTSLCIGCKRKQEEQERLIEA